MRGTGVLDEVREIFAEEDASPRFLMLIIGIMVTFLVVMGVVSYVLVFVLT